MRELIATSYRDRIGATGRRDCPSGVIHADLFPDNVLFMNAQVSGLIDFYFACNDAFAYDLAVMLNAWCFESDGAYNITKGKSLHRRLSQAPRTDGGGDRRAAGPGARRGAALSADAALRLAQSRSDGAGAAQGSARISQAAALSPQREEPGRVWAVTGEVIDIFTDGACSGNPGPGGWAAILRAARHERELSGGEEQTTNNRMELMAVIRALEALKRPSTIRLHTDSRYVMDGATKWLKNWKANGWKTADKKPVKNDDLWRALDAAMAEHKISWKWVRRPFRPSRKTSARTLSPARPFRQDEPT